MKFSHTLSLNANPDWADHYIDYAGLKKKINEAAEGGEDVESEIRRTKFLSKLTDMVVKARAFYDEKRAQLDRQLAHLQAHLEVDAGKTRGTTVGDDFNPAKEGTPLLLLKSVSKLELKSRSSANLTGVDFETRHREICDLFTQYHSLRTFIELNATAARKILKKYDKVVCDNLQETHLSQLQGMLAWEEDQLDRPMRVLQEYFAHFFTEDNKEEAARQMQFWVREVVSYQRHTVWLDVIEDQRKHESAQMKLAPLLKQKQAPKVAAARGRATRVWHKVVWIILASTQIQLGIVCVAVFGALLASPGIFDEDPTKRNALALFVFCSLLWATEALPLFVTAMLVPFLAVVLRVIAVDGTRLDAHQASQHIFSAMFSHVIVLLLGGFSIAAALSKHNIAQVAASAIVHKCGSGMRTVLLVHMLIATAASMWISNVAAPVLCYSLIQPVIKAATAETTRAAFGTPQRIAVHRDARLCRALVLGVALACNVGGMASPISSPQNLFAIEYTPIGWVAWFIVSIPLCLALDAIIWVWLIRCFKLPSTNSSAVASALQRESGASKEPFEAVQYFVMIVSVGVVLLWCASFKLETYTGSMGVLGFVPFILFFGTGVLSKEDLNNFLWSVVILAMGGLALGEAVEKSGLLDVIASSIATFIEDNSLTLWTTMCIFTSLILCCTTFVSHTVGAIVVLPIAKAVGDQMVPTSRAKELVFAGALACSAAMGLPVSGFPNMTAVSVEDNLGNRLVTTVDFLRYAVPASVFSLIVIVTFAYGLILLAVRIDQVA